MDIIVKRQAVKPKLVKKLTHNMEVPVQKKVMSKEEFERHERYMENVARLAGKTWPEVAAEFEKEMEAEKASSRGFKKGGR